LEKSPLSCAFEVTFVTAVVPADALVDESIDFLILSATAANSTILSRDVPRVNSMSIDRFYARLSTSRDRIRSIAPVRALTLTDNV